MLAELKEYATEVDVDFVRKAVRAIGRCAIKVEVSWPDPDQNRIIGNLINTGSLMSLILILKFTTPNESIQPDVKQKANP